AEAVDHWVTHHDAFGAVAWRVGFAEMQERNLAVGLDLYQRQVLLVVDDDDLRGLALVVRHDHHERLPAIDDVTIRDDQSVGRDEEAGSAAHHAWLDRRWLALAAFIAFVALAARLRRSHKDERPVRRRPANAVLRREQFGGIDRGFH